MVCSVPEIVAHLSSYYRLAPGDLILTGMPAGVVPVLPGYLGQEKAGSGKSRHRNVGAVPRRILA
jgi:2-keto-4-pentenoate hydratase/2-oxohepta-3-ene-1,7-dioic acid hydratase in catechol pathway